MANQFLSEKFLRRVYMKNFKTDIERFREITQKMGDLYEKKNANYGNSFEKLFNELGPVAGIVPLHNKLDRITNLVRGGKNDFESLEDSLVDLANYAIMNLIELQKSAEKGQK